MTYNEFILCCSLFEKYFKGKSLKEIFNDEHYVDYKLIEPSFDFKIFPRFGTYNIDTILTRRNVDCMLFFKNCKLHLNTTNNFDIHSEILCVKDFLNYFKIPIEDIV